MKESKTKCDLNTCFLCTNCIKDWLPAIAANKKNLEVKKGQPVFKEGEAVTGIYFIYSGKVKVHQRWDADKELILRFAKQGDILGHLGLGKDPVYPVSATAIEHSIVCYIDLAFFESSLNVNPKLTYALMKFFADELQESGKRMRNLAHMPVKERIALALLMLKERFGLDKDGAIDIELTRQDFSSFIGASYEALFRGINEFLQAGLFEISGKSFKLINEAALTQLVSSAISVKNKN